MSRSSAAWNLPNNYEPKGIYGLSCTTFLLTVQPKPHWLVDNAMQPLKISNYRKFELGKVRVEGDLNTVRDSLVPENPKIFSCLKKTHFNMAFMSNLYFGQIKCSICTGSQPVLYLKHQFGYFWNEIVVIQLHVCTPPYTLPISLS